MVELYLHFLMSSWRGPQLIKQKGNFTFTLLLTPMKVLIKNGVWKDMLRVVLVGFKESSF
jgi:hypothetical protein